MRDAEIRRLKLASGGQTGVDRAALAVAFALGPAGRPAVPGGGAGSGDRAGGVPGLAGRASDRRLECRWSPREPTPRRVRSGGARSGSVAAGRVPARGHPLYTPRALPESVLPHPFTVGE